MTSKYNAKLILAGDHNNLEVAPGADVTFDAEHLGRQPFQPVRLEIEAPSGWLVLGLRFNRHEQLAMSGVPSEVFAPEAYNSELVMPVVRPGEHVELVMRNNSTTPGKATAQLLGNILLRVRRGQP